MKRSELFFLPFLAFFFIGNSQATPIDIEFKGIVSTYFVDPIDPDPFSNSISPGTPIVGHYTFDPFALPTSNPPPTTGITSFTSNGLPFGFSVDIGGVPFSIDGALNIGVANNIGAGVDQYTVFAEKGIQGGLNDYLSLQLYLQDSTGTVFNNTTLTPLTSSNIQSFDVRNFFLDGVQTINGTIYQFQVQGDITDVPEPSSVLLVILALIMLSHIEYKRRMTN